MSKRDSNYYRPHRVVSKALERVKETQEGQRGERTLWKELQSGNRKERRRVAHGIRLYDKIHGEGAARKYLEEHGRDDEFIVKYFLSDD